MKYTMIISRTVVRDVYGKGTTHEAKDKAGRAVLRGHLRARACRLIGVENAQPAAESQIRAAVPEPAPRPKPSAKAPPSPSPRNPEPRNKE